jgi:hypothetical protein
VNILHELKVFATIISSILVWEFLKSEWFKDKIGWIWVVLMVFTSTPWAVVGTAFLGITFLLLHQFIAAGIMGVLIVVSILFIVTNGFGQSFK